MTIRRIITRTETTIAIILDVSTAAGADVVDVGIGTYTATT